MPAIGQAIEDRVNFMPVTTNRAGMQCHDVLCSMFGITGQGYRLIGDCGRNDEGFPTANIAQIQRQTQRRDTCYRHPNRVCVTGQKGPDAFDAHSGCRKFRYHGSLAGFQSGDFQRVMGRGDTDA